MKEPTPVLDAFESCLQSCYPPPIRISPAQRRDLQRFFFAGAHAIMGLAYAPELETDDPNGVRRTIAARLVALEFAWTELDAVGHALDTDPHSWPPRDLVD